MSKVARFTIEHVVRRCDECPHAASNGWDGRVCWEAEANREEDTYLENRFELTESCPLVQRGLAKEENGEADRGET